MMFGGFEFLFLLVGVGFFFWLRSRETKRTEAGQSRFGTFRLLLATLLGLIVLFSGGCSLLFLGDAAKGNQYVDFTAVLMIGGVPFAIAIFLLWLTLRRPNS